MSSFVRDAEPVSVLFEGPEPGLSPCQRKDKGLSQSGVKEHGTCFSLCVKDWGLSQSLWEWDMRFLSSRNCCLSEETQLLFLEAGACSADD